MAVVRVKFSNGADARRLAGLLEATCPLGARELFRTADRYGKAGELGADEVAALMALKLPADLRVMVEEWDRMVKEALAWEAARPRAFDAVLRYRQRCGIE